MKIAIIGTGNLGLSISKGIMDNKSYTTLYLTKRKPETLARYNGIPNLHLTSSNTEAAAHADILIFAVQPQNLVAVVHEVLGVLHDKHVLISTATGVKIKTIETLTGASIPIIRAMPNTASAVSRSMTCLCANSVGEKYLPIAEAIFNNLGESITIEETLMQPATVLCASGIAFWMRCIRAFTQGGVQMGFDADKALQMTAHTALGAAALLLEAGTHPEQEIDKVTTPKGCTITGLNEMEHQGLSTAIIKGLVASYHKINKIAEV
jgi:pyrroline-5-carboxylate reductase